MNGTRINGRRFQFLGYRQPQTKAPGTFASGFGRFFGGRRSRHDPMLVLNMSVFNFTDGWNRTFNKVYENVT